MTVYGHISSMMVKEGQVVSQGDIIGLSGGMPVTLGAGYMTTGPHLHLEFIQDGAYVDALRFLPLEALSSEAVSTLPESYMESWKNAVYEATGVMPDAGVPVAPAVVPPPSAVPSAE
jgi:murein DD-endopeptidase MepM/ murein hydrolase activator NlpD